MNLNYYEWIDSLGLIWHTVQSPEWADEMREDGYEVRLLREVIA
tara:strand:+ start:606 stop:737 length:132 start_codon:yes stop_codon:yes gene_type:complete